MATSNPTHIHVGLCLILYSNMHICNLCIQSLNVFRLYNVCLCLKISIYKCERIYASTCMYGTLYVHTISSLSPLNRRKAAHVDTSKQRQVLAQLKFSFDAELQSTEWRPSLLLSSPKFPMHQQPSVVKCAISTVAKQIDFPHAKTLNQRQLH